MSLATRCIACSTVFRVVEDQLKVSEGWVRCGRCKEVFNALENLFDLERDGAEAGADIDAAGEVLHGTPAAGTLRNAEDDAAHTAVPVGTQVDIAFGEPPGGPPGDATSAPAPPVDAAPSFLQAAKPPRVRRPVDRRWLAAASLLGLALAVQSSLHFRHDLAAQWPFTRPLLAGLCFVAGCGDAAPHRLEAIAVESSELTRAGAGNGDALRLQVVLRNRAPGPVAMPAIDLSLTDTGGQLVARRALLPADFRHAASLPPASETPLELLFSTGGRRVAGYTVEVFYP